MYIPFEELENQARVWVYQSDREFSDKEVEFISKQGIEFTKNWTAHSKDLKASIKVFYNQFIVLSVDESAAPATGCSIDKSVQFIRLMEQQLQVSLLDKSQIAYISDNHVQIVPLPKIKEKVDSGEISQDSIIFNNMVTDMTSFKNTWETPARNSWMKRYF